jgi:uncharacterized protein YyaL (SSP411 family)
MTTDRRLFIVSILAAIGATFAAAENPPAPPKPRPGNHLAKESSPYLLHHAHNPVDWYPWGEEALAKAKQEGKLIFFSSGYHACHWCHVMERESFMDEEVAAILNKHFVCIKVDREERPEVDHIYLTALNVMGQTGGWPLSMFLTADGKPIAGGTYWPREDMEIDGAKAPGFKTVLKSVLDYNQRAPADIQKTAELRAAQTKRALAIPFRPEGPVELNRELVAGAVERLQEMYDAEHGGFGRPQEFRGPKFPRSPYLKFLQSEAARTKSDPLAEIVQTSLAKMARGGIYDQIGGGFHRYTVERTWTVPHFEKMLSDNGQLLEIYARAYAETKRPLFRRVLEQTLAFVGREMTAENGAFYTSLDADSEGEEGRYYVWTPNEVAAVIPDAGDLLLFKAAFALNEPANFEDKYHILCAKQNVAEEDQSRLDRLQAALLTARGKRPRPALDNKVLTSWNGLMIAGLASAGSVLEDRAAVDRAARAADFLLKTMRTPEGRLLHTYASAPGEAPQARLNGCLDDYAYLAHGLLALHDATNDERWLTEARQLTETMVALFHDPGEGGLFYTTSDHGTLFVRAKDQHDGAQPSGNSQAAANLVRLWQKTGDEKYRLLAESTFRALAGPFKDEPSSLCTLAEALSVYLSARADKKP